MCKIILCKKLILHPVINDNKVFIFYTFKIRSILGPSNYLKYIPFNDMKNIISGATYM